MENKIGNFILDLFFPKFCLNCQKEGTFLCQDCQATLEISGFHKRFQQKSLSDLYFPLEYKNPLIKKLIQRFKYSPFIKEISEDLSRLIINHFLLMDNPPPFLGGGLDYVLVPVPLEKRKLKWRGFNQAEELSKELSSFLKIPVLSNCLIKIKETPDQVELAAEARKENLKGVFFVQKGEEDESSSSPFAIAREREKIIGKKILLIDDVYTTGSTMEECARVLKEAGAKQIIGIVVARASPDQDTPSSI